MIGVVFHCAGCHQLRPTQDGWLVQLLQMYVEKPADLKGPMLPGMMGDQLTKLTNGDQALFVPLVVCGGCLPPGADATPLADVGVRLS